MQALAASRRFLLLELFRGGALVRGRVRNRLVLVLVDELNARFGCWASETELTFGLEEPEAVLTEILLFQDSYEIDIRPLRNHRELSVAEFWIVVDFDLIYELEAFTLKSWPCSSR